ncbi:SDR family NAD(P)-dependent oxidoreductase [Fodinicurvata sediminis]|uniref:SDR family NAD(P)-dependent oxidoreductase n=1 Tax=Fodinicurvata sediminis TaxID=1121832 RepID=UPI0003B73022|nr:SDR family NAD(P)-dependent oxidoreductase [Fodinicurvata sediminis]
MLFRSKQTVPGHVMITGASSGLGAALAQYYAERGCQLSLSGRNKSRLDRIAQSCRDKGAIVEATPLDVCDREECEDWVRKADDWKPLDLMIANAGISAGTGNGGETEEQTRQILETNCTGLINNVMPVLERMKSRDKGQIALMSSLAAFRGFPGAPAYCGSKAMVRVWGEALRGELAPRGLAVNVICPGYVQTPMTEVNDFPMPFLMSAEKAAKIMARGLARNRARIAFPLPTYFAAWLLGALPVGLTDSLLARLPRKA